MKRPLTSLLPHLARAAVTGAVVWFVFDKLGMIAILGWLRRANALWLALAATITLAQIAALVWRWKLLHDRLTGESMPYSALLLATGRSLVLGQLMPTTFGTDAVRVLALAQKARIVSVIRSVACDRLVGLAALVAIVALTFPLYAALVPSRAALSGVGAMALCGIAGFAVLLLRPEILVRLPLGGRYFAALSDDLRLVARLRGFGIAVFVISIASQLAGVLLFVVLVKSLGGSLSPLVAAIIVPPSLLVACLPVSLGGWGVREASIAASFLIVGADPALGTMASILYGLTNPFGGIVVEIALLAASAHRKARNCASEDPA